MTSKKNLGIETRHNAEWLASQLQEFMKRLKEQGYTSSTICRYTKTAERFRDAIEQRGLYVEDLDGPTIECLQEAVLKETPKNIRTFALYHLERFIDHLIGTGVIVQPAQPEKEPTALDRLREEYDAYLRKQRGLRDSSINHCMSFLKRFMTFRFGEALGDLNSITPEDILAFICKLKAGSIAYRAKSMPSHLRNLFKFLFWSGKTKLNLANCIPRVAHPQPTNLPRYLGPDDVQRLIDAVRTDDAIGRRNYAMMLLLARLGLRATEVIAIQLDDIDWRAGEILIRGKGKLYDRMPLVTDVGEAIAEYVTNGRAGNSRTLFVSNITPHQPFKDAQILNYVLRDAFKITGLRPPQKYVGSHLLRHSLATDMLSKGASLDEIGDVLRHRSRASTSIYAKYDINALRSIARTWPVQGGA
jgi:integrase/recombinase XerD